MSNTVIDKLFVYGTLAPGRSNQHVLAPLTGEWQQAWVRGRLFELGWGAAEGYPGIRLCNDAEYVEGFLFHSADLADFWGTLDDFEGASYERVPTDVHIDAEKVVTAYVYQVVL